MKRQYFWAIVMLQVLLAASQGYSAMVVDLVTDSGVAEFVNRDAVMSNDLLETGSSAIASTSCSRDASGVMPAAWRDGTASTYKFYDGGVTGAGVTFNLDDANGGSSDGYDIDEIRVFSGWGDVRNEVDMDVYFKFVGDAAYYPLVLNYTSPDYNSAGLAGQNGWETRIRDDSGAIANVEAITFYFKPVYGGSYGSVIRQIDIVGSASVPEPATMGLLGLGAVWACVRKRK